MITITINLQLFCIWYIIGFLSIVIGNKVKYNAVVIEDLLLAVIWGFGGVISLMYTIIDIADDHRPRMKNFFSKKLF